MEKSVEDVANEFIDTIGEKAEKFGMARTAGLLKGLLLVADGPLSLDEMAERLEVSKASVSTNIRLLERWKVARRVYNRHDRKNYYELRGDIWEIETEIASTIVRQELEDFGQLIARWEAELQAAGEKEAARRDSLLAKLADIKEYMEVAEHLLNVLLRGGRMTPANIKSIEIT